MRKMLVLAIAALVTLLLIASCTALRSGAPVNAAFDTPAKTGAPAEEQGWAAKYIPGVGAISRVLPPPSDARVKWDETYKKRTDHWSPAAVNSVR